jgi:hypothetical protein
MRTIVCVRAIASGLTTASGNCCAIRVCTPGFLTLFIFCLLLPICQKNRNITTDKCVTVRATCALHIQTGCSRRRAVLPVGQTKVFNLFRMFVHCIRCNRPIKVRRSLIALVDRKCNRQLQTNLRTMLRLLRGHFTIISHLSPSKF